MNLKKIAIIISFVSCTARTEQGAQAPNRSESDQTDVNIPVETRQNPVTNGSTEQQQQQQQQVHPETEKEDQAACLTSGIITMQSVEPYKFNFDSDFKIKEPNLQELIEEAKESNFTKDIFKEKNDILKSIKTDMGYKLHFHFIPEGTEKIKIKWLHNDMIVHTYDVDTMFYETQAFDFENSPIISVELRGKKDGEKNETALALYYLDLRQQT